MYHGVIPIYKESGMTSHDVVFEARKILKMKKVGHTGTLDPEVTGVLPLVLGQATKLTEYMQEKDKTYHAEVTLGQSTDTEDASGKIIEQKDARLMNAEMVDEVLESFVGTYRQMVPKYSSVKVEGKKLYEYARSGIEVKRPVKLVDIKSINRIGDFKYKKDHTVAFDIQVVCSKGTYIRTLAVDIGEQLNMPSHMSHLVRESSCGFNMDEAITLAALKESDPVSVLQPIENVVDEQLEVNIEDDQLLFQIKNGQKISKDDMIQFVEHSFISSSDYVVFKHNGKILGIYKEHETKHEQLKPFKMFTND